MGDGDHDRTKYWEIVALHPQVRAGEGGSAVFFNIAPTTVEVVQTPVYCEIALEVMGHAEYTVPTLHREKTKWPHDVGTERCKWSVDNFAVDTGQLNMTALL